MTRDDVDFVVDTLRSAIATATDELTREGVI
jgi:hypothetical protein